MQEVTANTTDSGRQLSFTLFLLKIIEGMGIAVNQIHIGSIIHKELKSQRRSAAWLADQIPCDRTNIYRILKKKTLDIDLLWLISKILKTNFLKYYYDHFSDVEK